MCGIIAILGHKYGFKYCLDGLKMLQNRGYDSSGVCSLSEEGILVLDKYASTESVSSVKKVEDSEKNHNEATVLCMHTRWATTGGKTDENAHPHLDHKNRFAIVHNGIIENYFELKKELIEKYKVDFKSQTDTEVIVNLISVYYDEIKDEKKAIEMALQRLEGTWGLVIISVNDPSSMYCARHGSPLLIGFGEDFIMVSSEQSGFSKYVNNYICLNDNDLVKIEKNTDSVHFTKYDEYKDHVKEVTADMGATSPHPFPHWTLKEIYEQVDAAQRAMGNGGRIIDEKNVRLGGLEQFSDSLKYVDHLIILACGTSYHAGMFSMEFLKDLSGFDTVHLYDGAEFSKKDIPKSGKTALLLMSQSGETKDLHQCIDIGKELGLIMIGVVNVVDSLIAREVTCGVYLNAGREVGVASTKVFTSQVIVLTLISLWFAQIRNINEIKRMKIIDCLRRLPIDIKSTINISNEIKEISKYLLTEQSLFILGKGQNESIAREGSLKIKEIGYIHAEGYSSSALKHGPYSLIVRGCPIILVTPDDEHFVRNDGIADEVLSRDAFLIGISDKNLSDKYDVKIKIPNNQIFKGLLSVIPLQLIAYELALIKHGNPDQPRNLAKTVTTF